VPSTDSPHIGRSGPDLLLPLRGIRVCAELGVASGGSGRSGDAGQHGHGDESGHRVFMIILVDCI
jgi:hypothetical protein